MFYIGKCRGAGYCFSWITLYICDRSLFTHFKYRFLFLYTFVQLCMAYNVYQLHRNELTLLIFVLGTTMCPFILLVNIVHLKTSVHIFLVEYYARLFL